MNYYDKSFIEVARYLGTNLVEGLSKEEARARNKKYGENVIEQRRKVSQVKKFLNQFNDFMVIVLLVAAGISFAISITNEESDFIDSIIILVIIMVNAVVGFIQENKAERSIEALKRMSVPMAKVIRGGELKSISAREVTVGDILVIHTGDYVVADGRLISDTNLKIDEAMLTGESTAVEKNSGKILKEETLLADRVNMIYSGSFVSSGRGKAIVTGIGMETQVGKIADMIMASEETQTPLQKRLERMGKVLGVGAIIICGIIFLMGILRRIPIFEMFMTSVSLGVAAIPEGLPAIVTIVLAIGVRRMANQKAIVKKLPAVETLGSAQVICTDKTGTLTQNKMQVVEVKNYLGDIKTLLKYVCLCNNAIIGRGEDGKIGTIGDSTEVALLLAAVKNEVEISNLEKRFNRVGEIPFDSQRKLMTTMHRYISNKRENEFEKGHEGKIIVITKGAPDVLLPLCEFYISDGKKVRLSRQIREKIIDDNRQMAANALRVIAVAYKLEDRLPSKDAENNLIFAGLFGMIDPPRPEVFEAVRKCKMAGIKPVMITGDHILTAEAIAKKLGIMQANDKSMTGLQLSNISDEELAKNIFDYSVFARVSPEHKMKIVRAFQNNNSVVAMTGDGVNDAPALKVSDIGCAMGKTGTDVAKSAADMILIDDNFSTIIEAVREGRGIYANIRKAVHFLLSSNIGEIITIFMAMFFGWAAPLLAIQLLWVNLVTDSLPAIALGMELPEDDIMQRKPIKKNQGLFTKQSWIRICLEGAMIGLISLMAYGLGNVYYDLVIARTMAFATLSLSQLVHVFNMRVEKSIFATDIFSNKYVIYAFLICCILQVGVIMFAPFSSIFHVRPLNSTQWFIVIILSLVPILIVELEKKFSNNVAM